MGTNFYLKRKINESTKKVLKDCIDKDDIDTVRSILNDYKDIHIGKRSAGWKFLWDAHYFKYFEPNKDSILRWLMSGIIYDEYGRTFDINDFLYKELDGFIDKGYDIESFYNKETPNYSLDSNIKEFKRRVSDKYPAINKYGEFYIDNLRFTVNEDFS